MSPAKLSAEVEDGLRLRGAREYFVHKGEYRNPFPLNSAEFNAYERGWTQSLKRNAGKLVNPPAQTPARKNVAAAPACNAYAELKGRARPRK